MELKTCIVLGANGYLGLHLAWYLAEKGIEVKAYDNHPRDNGTQVTCHHVDITDVDSLAGIDWNVDAVFHFAGLTGTHVGFERYADYMKVNEIGLLNVLTAIHKSGHKPRFVLPSTRLVYKGCDTPLSEDAPKEAKTIYAANKISGELLLETYRNMFGLDYTVFRICVPYGNMLGGTYSYGTIGFFINQSRDTGVIRLFGDGNLRRTFTHVEDLCKQVFTVTQEEASKNEIFNIAGEAFSLKDVASLVAHKYNARVEFAEWPAKDLTIESGHTVFDYSKIKKVMTGLSLKSIVAWIHEIV